MGRLSSGPRAILAGLIVWIVGCGLADAQPKPAGATCATASAPVAPVVRVGDTAAPANSSPAKPAAVAITGSYEATVVFVAPGRAALCAGLPSLPDRVLLQVPTKDLRDSLAFARPGDLAKIEVDEAVNPSRVTKVTEVDRPVDAWSRVVAIGISAVVLAVVMMALTGFKPQRVLIGVDNRYSNSQCQFALWFGAVAIIYGAAVGLRIWGLGGGFIGGVGLPQNLIVLTGLSALTFGGAKAISAQKVASAATAQATITAQGTAAQEAAVGAAIDAHNVANVAAGFPVAPAVGIVSPIGVKTMGTGPNLLKDLTQNDDGRSDIGDIQMILGVIGAVIIFIMTSFHFLGHLAINPQITLPDVDTTLLTIFGLGQGAYLIKKSALPLGQG